MTSQNNEEQLIRKYFKGLVGSCLDLGANDGITLSNTRACILRGWAGVMVEASTAAFDRLRALYGPNMDVHCLNVAVGDHNGEVILHESGAHLGKGDVSLLSTTVESELDRWVGTGFTPEPVRMVDFSTLLEMSPLKTFDLISIDIEGMDLAVLRQMDLNALKCSMLIVEFNGKDRDKFDRYVLPFGFLLYSKNGENLIYVR